MSVGLLLQGSDLLAYSLQIAQCSVHKSGALLLEDREGQFWDENLVRSSRAEPPQQQQSTLGKPGRNSCNSVACLGYITDPMLAS